MATLYHSGSSFEKHKRRTNRDEFGHKRVLSGKEKLLSGAQQELPDLLSAAAMNQRLFETYQLLFETVRASPGRGVEPDDHSTSLTSSRRGNEIAEATKTGARKSSRALAGSRSPVVAALEPSVFGALLLANFVEPHEQSSHPNTPLSSHARMADSPITKSVPADINTKPDECNNVNQSNGRVSHSSPTKSTNIAEATGNEIGSKDVNLQSESLEKEISTSTGRVFSRAASPTSMFYGDSEQVSLQSISTPKSKNPLPPSISRRNIDTYSPPPMELEMVFAAVEKHNQKRFLEK
ncbi:Unknown protein [Striga hermonthica]|uniref:Uncharacterized protein n=1 Tax=Striga hermonthica TaxID=68872 RepID=A0A9N7MNM7_STRHE|nr:Unknown protein [Striga hermonthica]